MRTIAPYRLSVPADVIVHDNKHLLSPFEWQEVEDNIDNIFIANKTNEINSFSDNNYKVGIKTDNGNYYGLVIGINKHDNLICTAIKSTQNGIEAFVDERGKKDKKKELSKTILTSKARAIDNSSNSITDNARDFNPNVNNHEDNSPEKLYQTSNDETDSGYSDNNENKKPLRLVLMRTAQSLFAKVMIKI